MPSCHSCKTTCVFKSKPNADEIFGAPCDSCSKTFCTACSSLTTTEARAVAVAQRTIIYYCPQCKPLTKDVPNLKKIIDSFEKNKKELTIKDTKLYELQQHYGQQVAELERGNHKLQVDNEKMEEHIKRLKRRTVDFEESVFASEQEYIDRLRQLNVRISDLNKQIVDLRKLNCVLQDDLKSKTRHESTADDYQNGEEYSTQLKEKSERISVLNKDILELNKKNALLEKNLLEAKNELSQLALKIEDLTALNQNMISSIRTLETEKATYLSELEQLKIFLKTPNTQDIHNCTRSIDKTKTPKASMKTHQLLIIGDRNVRGLSGMIKRFSNRRFDVNCQWSDRIKFEDAVSLCLQLSRNFTRNDHVILFWGSENAIKGHSIKKGTVQALLEVDHKTNLTLIGPPLHANRPVLNQIIHDHNRVISSIIDERSANVLFLPLLLVTFDGIVDYRDKINLAQHLWITKIRPSCETNKMTANDGDTSAQCFNSPIHILSNSKNDSSNDSSNDPSNDWNLNLDFVIPSKITTL